jgi:hypothetical protein
MTHVFTFFELLSDIIKHGAPLSRILSYHLFLTPRLVYEFTPLAGAGRGAGGVRSAHQAQRR